VVGARLEDHRSAEMLPKGLRELRERLGKLKNRSREQEVLYRELEELDRQLGTGSTRGIIEATEKAAGSQQMSGGTGSGCPCCGS
jgi:hypothetical protein